MCAHVSFIHKNAKLISGKTLCHSDVTSYSMGFLCQPGHRQDCACEGSCEVGFCFLSHCPLRADILYEFKPCSDHWIIWCFLNTSFKSQPLSFGLLFIHVLSSASLTPRSDVLFNLFFCLCWLLS